MKNILVPTDFSVQSLQLVHEIIKRNPQQKLSIYLVHLVQIPTDIADLLFARKRHLYEQVPGKFSQAVEMLKNKYASRINLMGLEFYYGNTPTVVNAIIENRNIDEVYVFADHLYNMPLKQSVDMTNLLNKCKVPVVQVQPKVRTNAPAEAHFFSSLFTEEQPAPQSGKLFQHA
ncbi:MAG: hypothetical protein INR73_20405 [Williamsia sp.]|nr:hypothetical protein [Williamsia sp.]